MRAKQCFPETPASALQRACKVFRFAAWGFSRYFWFFRFWSGSVGYFCVSRTWAGTSNVGSSLFLQVRSIFGAAGLLGSWSLLWTACACSWARTSSSRRPQPARCRCGWGFGCPFSSPPAAGTKHRSFTSKVRRCRGWDICGHEGRGFGGMAMRAMCRTCVT